MRFRKLSRIAWILGICAVALGAAAVAIWWYLQPYERLLRMVAAVAPPETLTRHCEDVIGPPRIEQFGDRVFVALGYDLANTTVIATDAGNVVIDPGMSPKRARQVREQMARRAPGRTAVIIYTHSHIDHVGGASAWLDEGTEVWATEEFRDHFVKQYSLFRPIETLRAARQFGAHVGLDSLPCSALGRRIDMEAALETGVVMPTRTFSGRQELSVGGVRVELVEAHGETHDQLFVDVPELGALMPGDNYYAAFPNLYTIRGSSPRPIDAWIASLDEMRRREPEVLIGSHTAPIRGRAEVLAALTRYRDGIQWVRDRVISGANAGDDVDALAESIGLPERLARDPALAPLYGQIDWSARAIYANHLGWFDGRPEALYPMPRQSRARRSIDMMGGADAVWAEVEQSIETDPKWALSLLAQLADADGGPPAVGGRLATAKARALESLAAGIGNSNGRAYLLESAHELRYGTEVSKPERVPDELLDAIPIDSFFAVMATRLIPERSIDTHESVVFRFTDTNEQFVVTVRYGVAEVVRGDPLPGTPAPIAKVTTTTGAWRRIAIGALAPVAAVSDDMLDVSGEVTSFYTFSKRFRRGM